MFGGFVSAYLHFVRSKVVTRCVVEWGREQFQAGSGQVTHELSFSFCFNLSAEYASEFHRLGQIRALMIQNFVLIFATVVATPACPI